MNWQQLKAIVWLRWRLTRNQFVRAGNLNAVLSVLLLAVLFMAALGCGIGGLVLGAVLGAKTPPPVLLLAWDGVVFIFLIFWLTGLMVEIQRSESIDLTKLLHLPVTLQQVFVFNYAASHFTPGILVLLPGMIGLCLGLTFTGGLLMVLLLPLVLGFVFLITAWTYCLRGWLAALMVNKRRRRTIIVWVTIIFVLLAQVPNLLVNAPFFHHPTRGKRESRQHSTREKQSPFGGRAGLPEFFVAAHSVVPPGWVGYGAMDLRAGNAWAALDLAAACWLIGSLGLIRAYRITLRFYRGADDPSKLKRDLPQPHRKTPPRRRMLVERRLPFLPDDTAALALATFRSLLRAPELKMALIMPVVMGTVMASVWFGRPHHPFNAVVNSFLADGIVFFAIFSLAPSMPNVFGLDRNAFGTLILLPTRRDAVLMAKNLAFFPVVAGGTAVLMLLAKLFTRMSWWTALLGLLQLPTAFLLFSLLSNLLSILVPFRLASGSLKAKKPKAIAFVAAFGTMILTPLMLWPILLPAGLQLVLSSLGWPPWLPADLLATLAILAAVIWLYRWLLPWEGRLLQRREQAILKEVTVEIE